MPLRKRLQRHGNSTALVLDKSLLGVLGLDEGGEVSITIQGGALVIRPAEGQGDVHRRFQEALLEVDNRYTDVFRRLA